jgi:hypothetical protein
MTDEDALASRLAQRWSAFTYHARKDVPRTYSALSDADLENLLRQANQTLVWLARPNQKCLDSELEAKRLKALSEEERTRVKQDALTTATRARDELRRRLGYPARNSKA